MRVEEVAQELGVSKSFAVNRINDEQFADVSLILQSEETQENFSGAIAL